MVQIVGPILGIGMGGHLLYFGLYTGPVGWAVLGVGILGLAVYTAYVEIDVWRTAELLVRGIRAPVGMRNYGVDLQNTDTDYAADTKRRSQRRPGG